jgi:hypothetical protein
MRCVRFFDEPGRFRTHDRHRNHKDANHERHEKHVLPQKAPAFAYNADDSWGINIINVRKWQTLRNYLMCA